jgi:hypothetical protein
MGQETRISTRREPAISKTSTREPKLILRMENQSLSPVEASPNNTKPSTILVNQAVALPGD